MLTDKYKCLSCGYVYDPETGDLISGIPAGTLFEDVPDQWICPLCGVDKTDFTLISE
jgi:rubredoxin